jgi:ABC-type lipoprotein export system ATPase subunit
VLEVSEQWEGRLLRVGLMEQAEAYPYLSVIKFSPLQLSLLTLKICQSPTMTEDSNRSGEMPSSLADQVVLAYQSEGAGRIFALMGPNGAGKSRCLQDVKRRLDQDAIKSFLLPPDRRIGIRLNDLVQAQDSDLLLPTILERLSNPVQTMRPRGAERLNIDNALVTFLTAQFHTADVELNRHKDELFEWDQSGQQGAKPTLKRPNPIEEVEIKLAEILGYRTRITRDGASPNPLQINFRRGETPFNANALSDGEKQILLISIFLMTVDQNRFVFLVDEPELYLNEARAVQVWERLEKNFPAAIFLYATHSVAFATRPSVQTTYLIGLGGRVEVLEPNVQSRSTAIRQIVGARIQLLRTEAAPIFCEDGLAKLIIEDFLAPNGAEIVAVSGSKNVIAAVRKEVGWEQIRSGGTKFCGIIDRDTREDEDVLQLEENGVFCLPFYDSESFLLLPQVAIWFLSNSAGRGVEIEWYKDVLTISAKNRLAQTLDRVRSLLSYQSKPRLTFELNAEGWLGPVTLGQSDQLENKFRARAELLERAIKEKNMAAILKLFIGKGLYAELRKQLKNVSLPEAIQKYNEIRNIPDFQKVVKDIDIISDFSAKISSYLA